MMTQTDPKGDQVGSQDGRMEFVCGFMIQDMRKDLVAYSRS